MIFGRALLLVVFGLAAVAALTIVLSLAANIHRQLTADDAPAASSYHGACGAIDCDEIEVSTVDTEEGKGALQRGLRTYMHYCIGCHSLGHARYNRIAKDLEIPVEIMEKNILTFSRVPISSLMMSNMWPSDSEAWFGTAPPDLSLVARYKSPEWLYTYLRSFYSDPSRPTGYNNLVFEGVGMPNITESLQGIQARCAQTPYIAENGGEARHPITGEVLLAENCNKLRMDTPGILSSAEFDTQMAELVSFLTYVAEPYKHQRQTLGVYVILFLLFFSVLAGMLYREFKKDYPSTRKT